ncbi:DUF411 domain-containing protein [Ruegeria sediminis]|uniref:DUF411 domain-containing protein n=1 Tax=Ruegeria sediminis TaxID=2583820 RepID=A0ABY2X3Q6_9RHOB|nr:DUF411 domain-containing protein [Ruegeria sediminis]TMV09993.1 DUF411 domain-containing protein [Ruegeria sediminis]
MTMANNLSRRSIMRGAAALAVSAAMPAFATGSNSIHVLKDPSCGCCGSWIKIMQAEGFEVSVENVSWEALNAYKSANGIPEDMTSCHTGQLGAYFIEGHVPPADIRRLLAERPDAAGLSVPGMPMGSPGMGPESEREAFDVFLIRKDGTTEVFSSYPAA